MRAVFGQRGGVVAGGLLVAQHAGTPNMSVDIAEGLVVVAGTEATYQGSYVCEAQGVTTVTIAAADPTNPRRDLIIARVRDTVYSGASDTWTLEVVTGTPAASPADPALPTGSCWVLARVSVAAAASSILNASITDFRQGGVGYTGQGGAAAGLGGTIVCLSTFRPTTNLTTGMVIWQTDTKTFAVYNGATWDEVQKVTAWTTMTGSYTNGWADFGSGYQPGRYRKVGDQVQVEGLITGGTVGVGTPYFTLPSGFRPPAQVTFAQMANSAFARSNVLATGAMNIEIGSNAYASINCSFSTI